MRLLSGSEVVEVRSSFADALATFEAAARVNECLYGSTAELD